MRWSSDEVAWPVSAGARRFALRVRSFAPYAQQVRLRVCGAERTTWLSDHDWHTIEGTLEGCGPGDYVRLSVAPTWSPPADARTLGVVTADVTHRLTVAARRSYIDSASSTLPGRVPVTVRSNPFSTR